MWILLLPIKNEAAVGKALRDYCVPREEIFVTTKIPAELKSFQEAVNSIKRSMAELNTAYIDLVLDRCSTTLENHAG